MERTDVEGFVADFNRTYRKKTELKRVCGHRFYGETRGDGSDGSDEETNRRDYDEDELGYFQIGRRTGLPRSLVEERRYSYVSDAVVGALCEGEKTFLAKRLSLTADEGGIPTVEEDTTSAVEAALGSVEEPNHVLLPRTEEYEQAIAQWEEQGRLRRLGEESYLRGTEENEETDCWIHRYDATPDVRDAFVLDATRVTVVQKKGGDTRPPADFSRTKEYDDVNDDMPLGVYFGDETREGNETYDAFFDVVYRVVLSEPVVSDGGVCRVRCP